MEYNFHKAFSHFFLWNIIKDKYWLPSSFFLSLTGTWRSHNWGHSGIMSSTSNTQNFTLIIYFPECFQICQLSWFMFCMNVCLLCVTINYIGKVLIQFQVLDWVCIKLLKCTGIKHCTSAIIIIHFLKRCYSQIVRECQLHLFQ